MSWRYLSANNNAIKSFNYKALFLDWCIRCLNVLDNSYYKLKVVLFNNLRTIIKDSQWWKFYLRMQDFLNKKNEQFITLKTDYGPNKIWFKTFYSLVTTSSLWKIAASVYKEHRSKIQNMVNLVWMLCCRLFGWIHEFKFYSILHRSASYATIQINNTGTTI